MTAMTRDLRSATGMAYIDTGTGPAVLLVHGLISDRTTWSAEISGLQHSHRIIAPDLFGHGSSARVASVRAGASDPTNDYSLGGHAAALRDLLDELGLVDVVVVGHSLGGGIAMELAYLFPERVRGLVLVSSGGLGPDLGTALRAATLPGSEWVLPLIGAGWVRSVGNTALSLMDRIGLPWVSASTTAAWQGMATFADGLKRNAFLATARSVIGLRGQTISALPHLVQLDDLPILVIWGGRDSLIPAAHASALKDLLPGSVVEIFDRAGHFPHLDEPDRFHRILIAFLADMPGARSADPDDGDKTGTIQKQDLRPHS